MPPSPAPFVWYELMTTDASAAEKFYKDVVGWKAQDMSQGDMKYTALLAAGMPVAGLMTLPKDACDAGAKPGWTGYIGVDDVDATAARVTKAGGKIHVPPTDIPNVGRFAMMADPQGTVFCLFKPDGDMPRPAADPNTPGLVGWHELYALDGEKAFPFYAELFGWTKAEAMDMGAMGVYQLFAAGGPPIGGMMTKPPRRAGAILELLLPGRWHRRCDGTPQGGRRQRGQRSDGSARRQLDRAGPRSAGCDVLPAERSRLSAEREASGDIVQAPAEQAVHHQSCGAILTAHRTKGRWPGLPWNTPRREFG